MDTDKDRSTKTLHKICRTCLSEGNLIGIFEKIVEGRTVSQVLEYCASLKVREDDYLPKNICLKCKEDLLRAYYFINKCKDSENTLCVLLKRESPYSDLLQVEVKSETHDNSNEFLDYLNKSDLPESDDNGQKSQHVSNFLNNEQKILNNMALDDTNCNNDDIDLKENEIMCPSTENKFTCGMCRSLSSKLNDLSKQLFHTRNGDRTCCVCSKICTKPSLLKQHMRSHTKEKPYLCNICFKEFSNSSNLSRHKRIHSGEKPYVCDVCGNAFTQSTTLVQHKRIHTGETPFKCRYCGTRFRNYGSYKLHLLKHEAVNNNKNINSKHECPKCHKIVSSKASLYSHMPIHGDKMFLCNHCGKGFVSKGALQIHYRSHTGERPYSCQYCKKTFSFQGGLKEHVLIHKGIKPYVCKTCSRGFVQRHQLQYHMRIHSGEKPYTCKCCRKSFALKGNLTVHIRTHTGETPFVCSVCSKGFYNSSSLKKHKKAH